MHTTARQLKSTSLFVLTATLCASMTTAAWGDGEPRANAPTPPADPTSGTTPAAPSGAPAAAAAGAAPSTDGKRPATATTEEVVPPKDPSRDATAEPKVAKPPPTGRPTFESDPIADGAIIAVSLGFAGVLDLIDGTGEVRPQQISPNFDTSKLIGIDRGAISQNIDSNASMYSNVGLYVAVAYSVLDPILSGFRESSVQAGIVDGIMYAETMSLTYGLTNVAKIAVRRPRPIAYIDAQAHKGDPNYSNADTDSSLSFFSGHAAIVGAVSATATYLAFVRSPNSARPWITLIAGAALTSFVSYERVRAGAHFPTDVIAGSIAGAGIGVVVPHLHRTAGIEQRRVWVGYTPVDGSQGAQGGIVNVNGFF